MQVIDLELKQQHNGYDCGPFTVDNLIKIAGTPNIDNVDKEVILEQAVLQRPHNGSATIIRQEHNVLLNNPEANRFAQPSNISTTRLSHVEQ